MTEEAMRVALDNIKEDTVEIKRNQKTLEDAFYRSCAAQGERIGAVEKDVAVLASSIKTAQEARQDEYKTLQRNVSVGIGIITVIIIGLQFLLRLVGK